MVYVESTKDLTRIPIWEWQPEKFDFWERGRVEIPKWEEYRVIVTSTRGTGDGYVAVDDFTFEHGYDDAKYCTTKPDSATPHSTTMSPTTTTAPPVILPSCQFETDTCGWQVYGLQFIWYITNNTGLNAEDKPGPLGPASGNYLYSSGLDGFAGESTELESPAFEQTACLSFRFAMSVSAFRNDNVFTFFLFLFQPGESINSLRVKGELETFWELNDTLPESDALWQDAQVLVIGPITIQAIKGNTDNGFVAVDSVILLEDYNNCATIPADAKPTTPPTTTTAPPPLSLDDCDFEEDMCGWTTEGPGEFIFQRRQGQGLEPGQGPEEDHTGDSQRWFVLADGSYGEPDVSTALLSPVVTTSSDTCFSFWFRNRVI